MNFDTRKSIWAALIALAVLSAATACWLFPKAMPMLQLQVSMSRDQALDAAQALQTRQFPELNTTRAVAAFDHDAGLQNYIELEGGGVDAFTGLLGQRFIAPYHWTVRRFAESQEDELSVHFTPDGQFYGFSRKIPEKTVGPAISEDAARALAQAGARTLLGDPLWNAYAAQSASQITRPGGRVDHTFVYEHQTEKRGEARFRLRLVVAGDRLIEVSPYAFVPQAFTQRFAQLRTGNDTIAQAASVAVILVLGLGGVLGGWLWLARSGGGLAWRAALFSGALVGCLLGAALLSNLPLAWFGYATTDAASSFLLRNMAMAVAAAVGTTLLLGLVFSVAEGLSRRAFAQHPQVFSFWSVPAAASPQALGRTLGGYAWMCLELLLVSAFYLLARTQFGWWLPAESLSDPNILAAWRPALLPIAQALQAGTMEEALFRAIPLAGAALIGQRLGWQRSTIAFALVLQALVFASAHANYPGLPSYSRVVELFLPALVWGLIFLRYGLVPCMLMHFTFDLALMSLPVFVASDSRLWLDRALVLLAGLLPLLMVLRARLKQGRFTDLPAEMRNGPRAGAMPQLAATAPLVSPVVTEPAQPPSASSSTRPWWLRPASLLAAALLGALSLWLWSPPQVRTPDFTLSHDDAIAQAEKLLAQRGVRLDADWKRLAIVRPAAAGDGSAVRFVWREAGPQAFERLLGRTLLPQHWQVLFKHTSGPVEERSEVWEVALTGQGDTLALEHHLPEGRPGARLTREQALERVQKLMAQDQALAGRPWELASVQENERPARRDWTFFWDDKHALDVKGGTSRLSVTVRGDELSAWQYVFVPDAWKRAQQEAESARTPFKIASGIAGAGLVLLMLVVTLRHVVQNPMPWRQGLTWAGVYFAAAITVSLLKLDHMELMFQTAQPWDTQLITALALSTAAYLVAGAVLGLLTMRLHTNSRPGSATVARDLLSGLALAVFLRGVANALQHFFPENNPGLPGVGAWDSLSPWATIVLGGPSEVGFVGAIVALVLSAVQFCHTRARRLILGLLISVLALGTLGASETVVLGLAHALPFLLLNAVTLWALARRAEVGVMLAMLSLWEVTKLPLLLQAPIANATSMALLSCATLLVCTAWVLRYGRSLGAVQH